MPPFNEMKPSLASKHSPRNVGADEGLCVGDDVMTDFIILGFIFVRSTSPHTNLVF